MGSLPFHQKESIALFFMIFGWNFRVCQYFEAQKPYFGNFWGIGLIEFDESGMAGKLSWICVDSDYFRGFYKNLIFLDDFPCPQL